MKWLSGNIGTARGLRDGKLVTVPAGSVSANPTDDQVRRAIQGAFLDAFCTCLSDDEAVERFKEAKINTSRVRKWSTDNGIAQTAPVVRLFDPAKHLQYNMKIAGPLCGPCVDGFSYMRDWEYDGSITEFDCRSQHLVFGAPFLVPDSICEIMSGQQDMLQQIAKRLELSFSFTHGSAALDSLVIHSHLRAAGVRLPANGLFARTSTKSDGFRLHLRWHAGGLDCDDWGWHDDGRHDYLGCLALGVVKVNS
jgi:hypothetical protein